MKIKSIHLKNFKRFTDLKIKKIPEKAKLVVMIGPNGSGKSSVFDALNTYSLNTYRRKEYRDLDYYTKSNQLKYSFSHYKSLQPDQTEGIIFPPSNIEDAFSPVRAWHDVKVEFDKDIESLGSYIFSKGIRVRTAYRNSSTLPYTINRIDLTEERRRGTLIENDEEFASNYWKLAFRWLERSSEVGENTQNLVELQNEILGELRDALGNLFNAPPLVLKNLGHPLDGDLFQFDKGTSERFSFQNLASGEKAALDLLLDVIVTKTESEETIICIDEPEAHIHTKLQGQLLEELYNLIPDNSQLWIATHSIGMVRKAQDLWRDDPDSVVFLDFDGHDFDKPVTLTPTEPNPNFWARTYEVALGALAKLVTPEQIVLCESTDFDAGCYNKIFGIHYPDTRFVSIGNSIDIEKAHTHLIPIIEAIAEGVEILRIRDRDDATPQEIKENSEKGVRTLSLRNIEGYLLDDEVLTKLCEAHGKFDKIQDLLNAKQAALQKSIAEGKPPDDLKPTAQRIHVTAKNALRPSKMGNRSKNFMRDLLAPLIQPGMKVYEQLETDIFGE